MMADSTDYPRPNVKFVDVGTGVETTVLMDDADYKIWLQNCIDFHKVKDLTEIVPASD